jgi:dTDP-6-deoxy-L-talose 4-dehydrogenase (NAD+)
MAKTITVTGAGGYIGRHVISTLLDLGVNVNAVDINIDNIDPRANIIKLDIFSNDKSIYKYLEEPKICLHLAWQDGFNHNAESHIINLPKHYRFIKHLADHGLKQIAVMGTMHEIGYYEGEVNENTPTNPRSFYGIAKNALRQATQIIAETKNMTFQWLRAFYIVGDDLNNQSIFAKILEYELEGKEFFPFTSGKNKYDFININILANQISQTILQNEVTGIINCCSGNPVTLKQKVEQFIRDNDLKIKMDYGKFPERPYDSPAIWGDTTKIKKILKNS